MAQPARNHTQPENSFVNNINTRRQHNTSDINSASGPPKASLELPPIPTSQSLFSSYEEEIESRGYSLDLQGTDRKQVGISGHNAGDESSNGSSFGVSSDAGRPYGSETLKEKSAGEEQTVKEIRTLRPVGQGAEDERKLGPNGRVITAETSQTRYRSDPEQTHSSSSSSASFGTFSSPTPSFPYHPQPSIQPDSSFQSHQPLSSSRIASGGPMRPLPARPSEQPQTQAERSKDLDTDPANTPNPTKMSRGNNTSRNGNTTISAQNAESSSASNPATIPKYTSTPMKPSGSTLSTSLSVAGSSHSPASSYHSALAFDDTAGPPSIMARGGEHNQQSDIAGPQVSEQQTPRAPSKRGLEISDSGHQLSVGRYPTADHPTTISTSGSLPILSTSTRKLPPIPLDLDNLRHAPQGQAQMRSRYAELGVSSGHGIESQDRKRKGAEADLARRRVVTEPVSNRWAEVSLMSTILVVLISYCFRCTSLRLK